MKELLVYTVSGVGSLFILGYTVHIMIGGMVGEQTEIVAIIVAVLIGVGAIGWMVRDVIHHRQEISND